MLRVPSHCWARGATSKTVLPKITLPKWFTHLAVTSSSRWQFIRNRENKLRVHVHSPLKIRSGILSSTRPSQNTQIRDFSSDVYSHGTLNFTVTCQNILKLYFCLSSEGVAPVPHSFYTSRFLSFLKCRLLRETTLFTVLTNLSRYTPWFVSLTVRMLYDVLNYLFANLFLLSVSVLQLECRLYKSSLCISRT